MTAPAQRSPEPTDALGALAAQGWTILKGLVPQGSIEGLSADLEPAFEATPFCTGDFYGERTKRFGSLLRRSDKLSELVLCPEILRIVDHFLLPWCEAVQLNLGQAIGIFPGAPAQFPHRDQDMWQGIKGEVEYLVNIMWPLTPFTAENGATLIYPETHGARALGTDTPGHPICAECEPGDAIVFLGSTLHGAGENRTAHPRKAIVLCMGTCADAFSRKAWTCALATRPQSHVKIAHTRFSRLGAVATARQQVSRPEMPKARPGFKEGPKWSYRREIRSGRSLQTDPPFLVIAGSFMAPQSDGCAPPYRGKTDRDAP